MKVVIIEKFPLQTNLKILSNVPLLQQYSKKLVANQVSAQKTEQDLNMVKYQQALAGKELNQKFDAFEQRYQEEINLQIIQKLESKRDVASQLQKLQNQIHLFDYKQVAFNKPESPNKNIKKENLLLTTDCNSKTSYSGQKELKMFIEEKEEMISAKPNVQKEEQKVVLPCIDEQETVNSALNGELLKQISDLQGVNTELAAKIQDVELLNKQLESDLVNQFNEKVSLQNQIQRDKDEIQQIQQERSALKDQVSEIEGIVESLKQQLLSSSDENKVLNEKVNSQQQQIQGFSQLEQNSTQLRKQFEIKQKQLIEIIAEQKDMIAEYKQNCDAITKQFMNCSQMLQQKVKYISELEEYAIEQQVNWQQEHERADKIQQQVADIKSVIETAQMQYEIEKDKIQQQYIEQQKSQEDEIVSLKLKNEELELHVQELQTQDHEQNSQIEFSQVQQELISSNQANLKLLTDNAQLQQANVQLLSQSQMFEKSTNEFQKQIQAEQVINGKISLENQILKQKIDQIALENKELKTEYNANKNVMSGVIDEMKVKNVKLSVKNQELIEEISKLKEQSAIQDVNILDLINCNKKLKEALKQGGLEQITTPKLRPVSSDRLQDQLKDLESCSNQIALIQKQNEKQLIEIAQLKDLEFVYQSQIQDLKIEQIHVKDELKQKLEQSQSDLHTCREQLQKAQTDLADSKLDYKHLQILLTEEIQSLKEELLLQESENKTLILQLNSLESNYQKVNTDYEKVLEENSILCVNVLDSKNSNQKLKEKLKSQDSASAKLTDSTIQTVESDQQAGKKNSIFEQLIMSQNEQNQCLVKENDQKLYPLAPPQSLHERPEGVQVDEMPTQRVELAADFVNVEKAKE